MTTVLGLALPVPVSRNDNLMPESCQAAYKRENKSSITRWLADEDEDEIEHDFDADPLERA